MNQPRKKIQQFSFMLSDVLGKGFSSTVYRAQNDLTNEPVAMKVILLKSLRDHISRNMLQTELHCLKLIHHNNLLAYRASYSTVNNCYIVTQLCQGGDLARRLRKVKRFTQGELCKIFYYIFQGYKALNAYGYIHRDLKPANIFLESEDITSIRIADFGFVKKISEGEKESYNVGTPMYMSPQSMFSNTYSQRSDIWSLGAIIYELVYGVPLWKGRNEKDLKAEIAQSRVEFRDDLNIISQELKSFILGCLNRNQTDRLNLAKMEQHPWMLKATLITTLGNGNIGGGTVGSENCNIASGNTHNAIGTNPFKPRNTDPFKPRNTDPFKPINTDKSQQRDRKRVGYQVTENDQQNCKILINIANRQKSMPKLQNSSKSKPTLLINMKKALSIKQRKSTSKTTKPEQNDKSKQPNPVESRQKKVKKQIKQLLSSINYMRLIHKILSKIKRLVSSISTQPHAYDFQNTSQDSCHQASQDQHISSDTQQGVLSKLSCLQCLLSKELLKILDMHEKVATTSENEFSLQGWVEPITDSQDWITYQIVIAQYSSKYRKDQLLTNMGLTSIKLSSINELLVMCQLLPCPQCYELLSVVDLSISFWQSYSMIHQEGWNHFTKHSNIEHFIGRLQEVKQTNYIAIMEKLKDKIMIL